MAKALVNKNKSYFIKTFGCQANIADSNTLAGMLDALGYEELSVPGLNTYEKVEDTSSENDKGTFANEFEQLAYVLKNVDILVINTCSVRQKSEDKVYGIGKIVKQLKDKGEHLPFIVLSGCMVGSATGERTRLLFSELQKKVPWVNMFISPSEISLFPQKLIEQEVANTWHETKSSFVKSFENKGYVNISTGCDNFCTYCVVPYSRGKELSRSKEDIIRDVKKLLDMGVSHITLCGQNVNSWGLSTTEKFNVRIGDKSKLPFADLLRELHELTGLQRLEFLSSNPFDFSDDLIDVLRLPKISNYLHIAVQSGNDDVLKRMNRRHTISDFISLTEKIRKVRPDIELGTDFIVGFPGETVDQFMDTVALVKKVKFAVAYISMYSPRKGTTSAKLFKDDVPLAEKKRRHSVLTKAWTESKKNLASMPKKVVVLVGPTSSGKTSIALDLAARLPGETCILSADSRQLYKFLDIGTGKIPTKHTSTLKISKGFFKQEPCYFLNDIPVVGYDLVNPDQSYSAYDYCLYARTFLKKMLDNNVNVLLVGGTGFFIDAVTGRMSLSSVKPNNLLREELNSKTLEELQNMLRQLDKQRYSLIDLNNKVRVVRALEIALNSSETTVLPSVSNISFIYFGLKASNDYLFSRVDAWVDSILETGLIEEVQQLLLKNYANTPVLNGLVYKTVKDYLLYPESMTLDQMTERIKYDLHAYIRRQLTWFKRNADITWFDTQATARDEIIESLYNSVIWTNN